MKNRFKQVFSLMTIAALGIFISCGDDDGGIKIASDLAIAFSTAAASVAESGSDATVTLSFPAAPVDISVSASVSGTAVYTTDYTTSPAVANDLITLSIKAGETSASITLTPVDNNVTDGSRTVILDLVAATGIELGTISSYTVTITDDDAAGVSSINEDFESTMQADGDVFAATDWLNIAEAGTHFWEIEDFNNWYVEFTAFSTGESSNIGWLVLPKINFDDLAVSEMSFWNQIGFGDVNTLLDLMYSTDFDGSSGSIATATWTDLPFNISTNDNEWVESGAIDLSGISGNGYIAFRYTGDGTDSNNDASYRIDNLLVGSSAPDVTVTASLTDFGDVANGASSSEQSFTLIGTDISGDVTVTASSGFDVSLTSGSGFGSSVTISDVSTSQTVFVRFSPISGTNQAINGTITVSAVGIADRVVDASGTESGNAAMLGLLEENFDYGSTAGDLTTVSNGNWVNHSGAAPIGYVNTSLSMAGYAASGVGGSMTISDPNASAEDANRSFTNQTTGVVYAGVLVNLASFDALGDDYFIHFKESPSGFGAWARVHAQDDGSGGLNFGVSQASTSSTTLNYSATTYAYNTTYLLVMKYDLDAGSASIYVLNTVPATEPASADATSSDGTPSGGFSTIAIRQGSNTPIGALDGIIVTTNWSDFVLAAARQ